MAVNLDYFRVKQGLSIDDVYVLNGSGSPESSVTAPVGSIYTDTSSGVMYIKKSGTGNTGWDPVAESNKITDADGDTYVEVESGTDNDAIELYTAGSQRMTISSTGAYDVDSAAFDLDATGAITINTANAADASDISVTAGNSSNVANDGGLISLTAGNGGSSANGGDITLTAGNVSTNLGGKITIGGGSGNVSGSITIDSQTGANTGNVILKTGAATIDSGYIEIVSGAGGSNNGGILIDVGNTTAPAIDGLIRLAGPADSPRLTTQPTGSVDLAIATTKYVNDQITASTDSTRINDSGDTTYVDTDQVANTVTMTGQAAVDINAGTTGIDVDSDGAITINTTNQATAAAISITAGNSTGSGVAGPNINISAGDGAGSLGSPNGGAINITSGDGNGSGNSGAVTIESHTTTHYQSGNLTLKTGNAGSVSGDVYLQTGTGGAVNGGILISVALAGTITDEIIKIAAAADNVRLNAQPTGSVDLAVCTTKYAKDYADSVAQGLNSKTSVKCATTTALTGTGLAYSSNQITWTATNGPTTIDGVSLTNGDRILVKDETDAGGTLNAEHNGIYVRTNQDQWDRADDMNTWDEHVSAYCWAEEGTDNADTAWVCTVDSGGTLGTTDITFVLFSSAGALIAGSGLSKTGDTIDLDLNDLTDTAIDVSADLFAFEDVSDSSVTRKESIADLITAVAGTGLAATSGVLSLDLNELTDTAINVGSDSIAFIDASDSNNSKKESVADFATAIAGDGLSATSGVIDVDSIGTVSATADNQNFAAGGTADSVAVASYCTVEWLLTVKSNTTGTNREAMKIVALNDGTINNIDYNVYSILSVGSAISGLSVTVDGSGSDMRLRITASENIDYRVTRIKQDN